mmetsp:Transcript_26309/g.76720  ORF Transcript_26309/g.76720 Transcript_26309/m.76720 type:complete len:83 (+) Transcript_26309:778-1026(+)
MHGFDAQCIGGPPLTLSPSHTAPLAFVVFSLFSLVKCRSVFRVSRARLSIFPPSFCLSSSLVSSVSCSWWWCVGWWGGGVNV